MSLTANLQVVANGYNKKLCKFSVLKNNIFFTFITVVVRINHNIREYRMQACSTGVWEELNVRTVYDGASHTIHFKMNAE